MQEKVAIQAMMIAMIAVVVMILSPFCFYKELVILVWHGFFGITYNLKPPFHRVI